MTYQSDNCIICAEEFEESELKTVALSTVNVTRFKICSSCLNKSNPEFDYQEVRKVVAALVQANEKLK